MSEVPAAATEAGVDAALGVNAPTVIAQDFDGEEVIVHLGTGMYFSLDAPGSQLWRLLEDGTDRDLLVERARSLGLDEPDATVDRYLAELLAEDLIVTSGQIDITADPVPTPIELRKFSDLADVLLVDPIHDLDLDGDGWPIDAGSGVGRPRPDAV